MKAFFKSLALLTVLAFPFAPALVRAQDDSTDDQGTSFQTFYDQLGSQGTWVQTDDYGYVFQPNVTDPNWAPYTDGHWVNTDDGWTWVSDEPWGWATYHYGRWANIDGTGWVWVPGYQWAPAWVSWRYGGGYAGWAPLPPGGDLGINFHFGNDVDVSLGIGAGCYNFLAIGDMGDPDYRGRFINRDRNFAIINNTRNVTNINYYGGQVGRGGNNFGGVKVGGPTLAEINAHSHQPIQTVKLTASNQPGRSMVQGNSLAVFAPRVNPATLKQARPASVSRTIAHPTFNRGVSITKPLQVTSSVQRPPPSSQDIQAAQKAQAHIPAKAGIATDKTPIKTLSATPKANTGKTLDAHPATVNANERRPAAASSPFTGESVKPPVTRSNEIKPQNEIKPATASHPENEGKPARVNSPPVTHTENIHPSTGGGGNGAPKPPERPKAAPPKAAPPKENRPPAGGNADKGDNKNDKP